MKFKIFALILGCMCMCFLPCLNGVVCAKTSSSSASATVSEDTTLGQKTEQKLKKVKKELIICVASAVGFGLGFLLLIPFAATGPIPEKDLTFIGKVANNLWPLLVMGSPLLGLGALISAGIKICA